MSIEHSGIKTSDYASSAMTRAGIHFAAGGLSLATAFAVMHPLDSLKTQIQTNTFKASAASISSLSRGFTVSFLLAAPQGGLRLSTYEYCKSALGRSKRGMDWGSSVCSAIAACAGDTVSSIVKVPREVITARLQSGIDSAYLAKYAQSSPAIETAKLVVKTQGIRGLFRGFWSTSARDWPFMIILFTTYESFKHHHQKYNNSFISTHQQDDDNDLSTLVSTFFGGISGALAGGLTTPFDVVKTAIMTSSPPSPNAAAGGSSSSIREVGGEIWKRGGARAFFAGGGTRSVWWFCVCSIFFPLYERGKGFLRETVAKVPSSPPTLSIADRAVGDS